jgi:guanylate kinase
MAPAPPPPPTSPSFIVITGPSGAGKGTLLKRVLAQRPDIQMSISATTRAPRPGETHGVAYWFYTREQFEQEIAEGGFLEWANYNGNYYGTPLKRVKAALAAGHKVLLEIEVQGALQVAERFPNEAMLIFLAPPSLEALQERLETRGTESPEQIARRVAIAAQEMTQQNHFHHVVINDTLERAEQELLALLPPAQS